MSSQAPVAADEAQLETREVSQTHFLVKIDSFSLLERVNRFTSTVFWVHGYQWKLVIYPNGHGTGNDDKGFVSAYLAMAGGGIYDLPSNWKVNATFSICLFNHLSGNYCYSLGRAQRFHELKQEWGFKKFISKKDLTDPSNGYVVGDKCIFGAEVFVHQYFKPVIERLSLKSVDPSSVKYEIKIPNFSTLKGKCVSKELTCGGHKWKIETYPNGKGEETGRSLSIFLRRVSNNLPSFKEVIGFIFLSRPARISFERVLPRFTVRIKDQSNDLKHHEYTCPEQWFSDSKSSAVGWPSFIKLSSLNDPEKGFIKKDCCVLEIELAVVVALNSTW